MTEEEFIADLEEKIKKIKELIQKTIDALERPN